MMSSSIKTKAVVFVDENQVDFREVDVPKCGENDVLVETEYSWISNGTEASFLRGERMDGIHPWKKGLKKPFPLVPGYQKTGRIVEVGSNVKHLKRGQRVFVTKTKVLQMHLDFAGHIAMGPADVRDVYPIPECTNSEIYSGLVLTQVGYNAGIRGRADRGAYTAVIGDGMVGIWAAQTLQQRGFKVALVGKHDFRLRHFRAASHDLRIKVGKNKQWMDTLYDWSEGKLSMVIDSVGNDLNYEVNQQLLHMLKWGGHFVAAGHHGDHGAIDMKLLTSSEITLHCPCGWTDERLRTTMDWIRQQKLDTSSLITHHFPADEAAKAWQYIREHRNKTLGVILEWK